MQPDMLTLTERLDAYLRIVEAEPSLTTNERLDLFARALWPEPPEPDYEHMMQCRDKWCRECAGTGVAAA